MQYLAAVDVTESISILVVDLLVNHELRRHWQIVSQAVMKHININISVIPRRHRVRRGFSATVCFHGAARSSLVSRRPGTARGLSACSSLVSRRPGTACELSARSSLVSQHRGTARGLSARSSLVSQHRGTARGLSARSSLVSQHPGTGRGLSAQLCSFHIFLETTQLYLIFLNTFQETTHL